MRILKKLLVLKLKRLYALKLVIVPVATFVICLKPITWLSTILILFSSVVLGS
jgi:hypothetical protein